MNNDNRKNPFIPEYQQQEAKTTDSMTSLRNKDDTYWANFRHYFISRPMLILMMIAGLLEVQPIQELRLSYYIWNRLVNIEEERLKGVEDEAAHSEAVKGEVLAQIEKAKECQKQREINANTAFVQCNQSGGGAGYCRHLMESAKSVDCPTMPEL